MQNDELEELIWQKGRELYREMPWRTDTRPYYVLVSELMLQQTQVRRVVPKFSAFITTFPDVQSLAAASLADVLVQWQGLGYNRRAKYLHDAAKKIITQYGGVFPDSIPALMELPGVGTNTAGAIAAYSFNQPSIFIETNIRTVYIHHFFADDFDVPDTAIVAKLRATLDHEHPREFYWALMDYGSWLKANGIKNNNQSKHYKKQTPLQGSTRQVRGQIIRLLSQRGMSEDELRGLTDANERFGAALSGLLNDGLVSQSDSLFRLTK